MKKYNSLADLIVLLFFIRNNSVDETGFFWITIEVFQKNPVYCIGELHGN